MVIEIDTFTPCLENVKTGEIIPTSFSEANRTELAALRGWNFNWLHPNLRNATIYKLTTRIDDTIQGLIALTEYPRDIAVYINIAESAPQNLGKNKHYFGVGGHLFAIAAKQSMEWGYGGFLYLDAKNMKLVNHYKKALGAIHVGGVHPFRMVIDEDAAIRLIQIYSLKV